MAMQLREFEEGRNGVFFSNVDYSQLQFRTAVVQSLASRPANPPHRIPSQNTIGRLDPAPLSSGFALTTARKWLAYK